MEAHQYFQSATPIPTTKDQAKFVNLDDLRVKRYR